MFAPGHYDVDLSLARTQRNRLLPHARVVLEKNREVELCEFCQRVDHIDEIFFCLEKENETSHALWGC